MRVDLLDVLDKSALYHESLVRAMPNVKPRLFLLDYYLPDMNGIQLYDRLHARKELEAVPALIIGTSLKRVEDDINQRGLLAVENPFDLGEFLSTLESVFASSSGKLRW